MPLPSPWRVLETMIKVVGVAALLASSLLGVLGGGFSSNGELTPGGRCHLDAVVSCIFFSHFTLHFLHACVMNRLYPVVMLNSRNWRREVEESGHAVFINICRQG